MNDNEGLDKYEVGQKIWWKGEKGRFLFVVREIHPSLPSYYGLDAVYADNCLDVPDNWAHARDMRPLQLPPVSPTTVDVSTISEYGLTQKLSNSIRVY